MRPTNVTHVPPGAGRRGRGGGGASILAPRIIARKFAIGRSRGDRLIIDGGRVCARFSGERGSSSKGWKRILFRRGKLGIGRGGVRWVDACWYMVGICYWIAFKQKRLLNLGTLYFL